MSEERDQRVLRNYAAANATLNEAPGEQTRAAILAAAARAAGARPQPVGLVRRWRLPLAAAASVLVGTLAVLLATRIDESAPEAVTSSPPAASVASAPPAAEPAVRSEAPAPAADARVAAATEAAPSARAAGEMRKQRREVPAAPPSDGGRRDRAAAESVPESAVAAEQASVAGLAAPAASAAKPAEPSDARQRTAPSVARRADEGVGASRVAADAAEAESTWRATPASWIERIVKLRGEGRHDEAYTELALLRARHPRQQLPPAALPPPGR